MRVGILLNGLENSPNNVQIYTLEFLSALKAVEVEGGPEIALFSSDKKDPLELKRRFEYHSLTRLTSLQSFRSWEALALDKLARRYRLDLLHDLTGLTRTNRLPSGLPYLATVHNTVSLRYPGEQEQSGKLADRARLREILKQANRVLVSSELDRQNLREISERAADTGKIYLTGAGISPCYTGFTNSLPSGLESPARLSAYGVRTPYLLHMGGISSRKNLASLMEAYIQVRESYPELSLVLGGEWQWEKSPAEEMHPDLARLQQERQVIYPGFIRSEDMPALYKEAVALVQPSFDEGFNRPILEAMACGAPVITSNVASVKALVGEAAFQVSPHNLPALRDAITQVYTSPSLQNSLRLKGLAHASHYTWRQVAHSTLKIYEELCPAKKAEANPALLDLKQYQLALGTGTTFYSLN